MYMNIDEKFWNSSIDEMVQGYFYEPKTNSYTCLICGECFEKGVIYQEDNTFYEAEKYMEVHIEKQHSSMFNYLISLNKKFTGLTEHQTELLKLFYNGLSDKEIKEKTNIGSSATIRNHRFKLKEKEKQAKILLSIMSLLEKNRQEKDTVTFNKSRLIDIHKGASMVDERYDVTMEEKEKIIKTYFDEETGKLKNFPSKEKRKIITLQQIIKSFDPSKTYSEMEVSVILKGIYHDFATIRRYLIEYGFMERSKDGREYSVKK